MKKEYLNKKIRNSAEKEAKKISYGGFYIRGKPDFGLLNLPGNNFKKIAPLLPGEDVPSKETFVYKYLSSLIVLHVDKEIDYHEVYIIPKTSPDQDIITDTKSKLEEILDIKLDPLDSLFKLISTIGNS